MISQASQEGALERHMRTERDLEFVVEFLTKFGGSDLRFNQYSETILHLNGVRKGMKISDNAHESIAYERESENSRKSGRGGQ